MRSYDPPQRLLAIGALTILIGLSVASPFAPVAEAQRTVKPMESSSPAEFDILGRRTSGNTTQFGEYTTVSMIIGLREYPADAVRVKIFEWKPPTETEADATLNYEAIKEFNERQYPQNPPAPAAGGPPLLWYAGESRGPPAQPYTLPKDQDPTPGQLGMFRFMIEAELLLREDDGWTSAGNGTGRLWGDVEVVGPVREDAGPGLAVPIVALAVFLIAHRSRPGRSSTASARPGASRRSRTRTTT